MEQDNPMQPTLGNINNSRIGQKSRKFSWKFSRKSHEIAAGWHQKLVKDCFFLKHEMITSAGSQAGMLTSRM